MLICVFTKKNLNCSSVIQVHFKPAIPPNLENILYQHRYWNRPKNNIKVFFETDTNRDRIVNGVMLQLTQIVIFMEVSMQCGVAKLSSLKNCKVVIFVFVWLVFYQILANSSKILSSMIFLYLSLGTLKSYLM